MRRERRRLQLQPLQLPERTPEGNTVPHRRSTVGGIVIDCYCTDSIVSVALTVIDCYCTHSIVSVGFTVFDLYRTPPQSTVA